jgi:ribosomal protein L11 methyltransferase
VSWTTLRVESSGATEERRASVLAALFDAGAAGVEERDGALITHFPDDTDLAAVARAIGAADSDARIETAALADIDWREAWKARLGVQTLGALAVAPPWLAAGLDPARTIVIDPGMAFGTGDHPTTRGVLRLMPSCIRPGQVVADLGTGSAVLAIAAAKLGAARVAAIELDPDAIGNAEDNVARNDVADRVRVIEGDASVLLPLLAPVDVVLANLITPVILSLLRVIGRALAPHGASIVSGILQDDAPAVREALTAHGFLVTTDDLEEGWWSAAVVRA